MTAFFSCIILIGIGLSLASFCFILAEKKRMHDIRTDLTEKKDELFQVIEDTEALIQELNHFSDYVVSRCEEKQIELKEVVCDADQCLEKLAAAVRYTPVTPITQANPVLFHADPLHKKITPVTQGVVAASSGRAGNKVLAANLRCQEVMKLKGRGFDDTAIARQLNMGKGEIDLITRLGRQESH